MLRTKKELLRRSLIPRRHKFNKLPEVSTEQPTPAPWVQESKLPLQQQLLPNGRIPPPVYPVRSVSVWQTPGSPKVKRITSEVMEEEFDDTLLSRADIPKIIEAVLGNPMENSDATDNSRDNPHLDKQLLCW